MEADVRRTGEQDTSHSNRSPHSDPEIEQQVLGALLLDTSELANISPPLEAHHFSTVPHVYLFEGITEYILAHPDEKDVNLHTLKIALDKKGKTSLIGGTAYLGQLCDVVVTTAHIKIHAQHVVNLAERRLHVDMAKKGAADLASGNDEGATVGFAKVLDFTSRSTDSWGPVFPLDQSALPQWPSGKVLSPWADAFASQLAEEIQVGRDVTSSMVLSAMSIACAHRFCVKPKPGSYTEGLNLYIVVSLKSGSGKSPVFKRVRAPIEAYQKAYNLANRSDLAARRAAYEILESRVKRAKERASAAKDEDRAAALREAQDLEIELENTPYPRPLNMLVDDATPEALTKAMLDQGGRIALFTSEGGDVFAMMAGRYQSGEFPNLKPYLDPYDDGTLRVARQTKLSYEIERACLSMGLMTQPEALKPLGAEGLKGRGLDARILFNIASSTLGYRAARAPIMDPKVEQDYTEQMVRLLDYPYRLGPNQEREAFTLEFSEEATELYFVFKEELEKEYLQGGKLYEMSNWGGKIIGTTARIAALCHMGDLIGHPEPWTVPVSGDCWMRASKLTQDFWIPHARAAFGLLVEKNDLDSARCLLTWIQKNKKPVFQTRDAQRGMSRRGNRTEVLDPALNVLESHGHVRAVDPKPGPKGTTVANTYRVHPTLLAHVEPRS